MKKLISMLLALTLVLALVPTAFADEEATVYYENTTELSLAWGSGKQKPRTTGEYAHHSYSSVNGYSLTTKPTTGDTVLLSFDYMKDMDASGVIKLYFNGGNQRQHYPGAVSINASGGISFYGGGADGTILGQIEPNTWYSFDIKYELTANGLNTSLYLNGVLLGTRTDATVGTVEQIVLQASENTSAEANAQGTFQYNDTERIAERSAYIHFKNMIMTSDLSTLGALQFASVEQTAPNKVLFVANADITTPKAADILVAGVAPISVTPVNSKSFEATFENYIDAGTDTAWGAYQKIKGEIAYSVTVGDSSLTGTFTSKLISGVYTFDEYSGEQIDNEYIPYVTNGGNTKSQQAVTVEGKNGYAWQFCPAQDQSASGNGTLEKKDSFIRWLEISTPGEMLHDGTYVLSYDFLQPHDGVSAVLMCYNGGQWGTRDIYAPICLNGDGTVTFNGSTIATIEEDEWHNITVHYTFFAYGCAATIYFDGDPVVNCAGVRDTVIATYGVRSFATYVDVVEGTTEGANALLIDNVYIGRDTAYTTSDLKLSLSGTTGNAYSGALERTGVGVKAVYDSTGAITDVAVENYSALALTSTDFTSAVTTAAGGTVKFMVVDTLLTLRPLADVASATVN